MDDSPVAGWWLGAVVPKRHAPRLPAGLWVVRLRASFDRTAFPSAASTALRAAARDELDIVLARALR